MIASKSISIIYIGYVVPFSGIIPLVIGGYKYKYLNPGLRVTVWYVLLSLCFSVIVSAMASHGINNMPAIHAYTLLEMILLSVFYTLTAKRRIFRKLIPAIAVCYILFFLADVLYYEPAHSFNSVGKTVETIIMILLSMGYFIQSLEVRDKPTDSDTSLLLANAGILLYFSSSLAVFIIDAFEMLQVSTRFMIWDVHATCLLVMFILFSIGLWKYKA